MTQDELLNLIDRAAADGRTRLCLSGLGLTNLPSKIGQLSNLRSLDLMDNQLSNLPLEIGKLTNLLILYLNGNQLSSLPESIGQLSSLQSLYLNDNCLTSIPESIGRLSQLSSRQPAIQFAKKYWKSD